MIDQIDVQIVYLLEADGRLTVRDIAKSVGLSAPSVTERMRRLHDIGAIKHFTLKINQKKFGYLFEAIVRIKPLPGQMNVVLKLIEDTPEFIHCDKVTGDDCYIARLALRDMEDLDAVLVKLHDIAATNTSIVHSSPVANRLPPLKEV